MGMRAKIYRWLLAGYQLENSANGPMKIEGRGSLVKRLPRLRSTAIDELPELDSKGIYFKVIPGSGGIAIEVSHYDTKSERDITTLHIIPEGDELSESLAQIITLEAMKR
jgi:hypothetical protein